MPKKPKTEDSGLVTAARAIGSVIGKSAAKVGAGDPKPAPKAKKGKLQKKDKHRLPRREKKAQRRAAASKATS